MIAGGSVLLSQFMSAASAVDSWPVRSARTGRPTWQWGIAPRDSRGEPKVEFPAQPGHAWRQGRPSFLP